MKKFIKIISIFTLLGFLTLSCSEDDDSTAANMIVPPSSATLIFPENNMVCNEGTIISDTETDVLFQWEESENTSSYVLQITNLNDGNTRNISTLSTEFLIRITRGTPYSWSVKSLGSDGNESTESSVWSFYNAGLPVENYAPFPATLISPNSGSSVEQGLVTLEWEASDIDDDIASYTVFFDTVSPPIAEVNSTSSSSSEVTVSSGKVYYWRIVTTDEANNTSTSQVFQFAVN